MGRFTLLIFFFCLLSSQIYSQSNILFSRSPGALNTGGTLDLMIYNPSDQTTNILLKGSVSRRGEYNVATSPDNSIIIFNTYRFNGWKLGIGSLENNRITNVKRFTNRPNYEYNAKFSSDGSMIAYQEYDWGASDANIFITNNIGRNVKQLTRAKGQDRTPDWTRDNASIVFTSDRTTSYSIYIKPINGASAKKLTDNSGNEFAPSTSKTEDKIAFLSDREGRINLYVIDLNGANNTKLTHALESDSFKMKSFGRSGAWAYKTSWSPDGKQIVFNALKNGYLSLFIINSDGTNLRQVTSGANSDVAPFWTY